MENLSSCVLPNPQGGGASAGWTGGQLRIWGGEELSGRAEALRGSGAEEPRG